MTREPVTSSHIRAIGHDPESRILSVEFATNRLGGRPVWEYHGVDAATFDALKSAPSIGRAFAALIRNSHLGMLVAMIDDATGVETPVDAVLR
jgi:hypothetical protein